MSVLIEHSCPYIDEILDWLDPEEKPSDLTLIDVKNRLEKIRSINDDLRSRCVSLEAKVEKLTYERDMAILSNTEEMRYDVIPHTFSSGYIVERWTGKTDKDGNLIGYDWVGKGLSFEEANALCNKCRKGEFSEEEIRKMIDKIKEELGMMSEEECKKLISSLQQKYEFIVYSSDSRYLYVKFKSATNTGVRISEWSMEYNFPKKYLSVTTEDNEAFIKISRNFSMFRMILKGLENE